MEIILGSSSPRRKEILSYFKIPFKQVASHFDEEAIPFQGDPILYAKTLSEGKAKVMMDQFPKSVIISADTVVFLNGQVYGKPTTVEHAYTMLQELQDKWHSVFTAVTVASPQGFFSAVEETKVLFHPLSLKQIQGYVAAFHVLDKAGSYGIQNGGSLLIKEIRGSYENVAGLPVSTLQSLLLKAGIDLWEYIK